MKKPVFLSLAILLVAAILLFPACTPSESAVPTGPPIIKSFTVEDDTIEPGEAPQFRFEVANASSITIRQGGEVVFEIDATGTEAASLKPQGNVAYALPVTGVQPDHTYPAGVYPVEFNGASCGEPAKCVWKPNGALCKPEGPFDCNTSGQPEIAAEMEVRSPDGQVATQELTLTFVPSAAGEAAVGQVRINKFATKNVEGVVGEPVELVIDVSNPAVITIDRDSSTGTSFQKGVTIFRQEFTSDAGCPFDFKATVTVPPPTERGKTIFYRLTVTDGAGQKVSKDMPLDVCAFR